MKGKFELFFPSFFPSSHSRLFRCLCVQMCLLAFEVDMEKAFAHQLSQDKVGTVSRRHLAGATVALTDAVFFRYVLSVWKWWCRR